jgi:hypothetical protein
MPTVQELESRRDAVPQEVRSIRSMKRGTINEQFLEVHHSGIKEPITRGPYYVLSRYEPRSGKNLALSLKTGRMVPFYEARRLERFSFCPSIYCLICR